MQKDIFFIGIELWPMQKERRPTPHPIPLRVCEFALEAPGPQRTPQKPLKISVLETFLIKKHKYSASVVKDFMSCIDISLYYPLIYRDRYVR